MPGSEGGTGSTSVSPSPGFPGLSLGLSFPGYAPRAACAAGESVRDALVPRVTDAPVVSAEAASWPSSARSPHAGIGRAPGDTRATVATIASPITTAAPRREKRIIASSPQARLMKAHFPCRMVPEGALERFLPPRRGPNGGTRQRAGDDASPVRGRARERLLAACVLPLQLTDRGNRDRLVTGDRLRHGSSDTGRPTPRRGGSHSWSDAGT